MFFRWNWKRKGSRFFALAVFLTLLGSVISPLTAIMVSYKTKQLPLKIDSLAQISDLYTAINGTQADSQYFMTSLRNKLASTKRSDAQSRLWSDTGDCNKEQILRGHAKCEATFQSTLFELAYLAGPFWAHPVVDFNTGAVTQFTPRLNSTSSYEVLDDEPLPADCAPKTDALYIHYENSRYNATFCVPGNLSRSPWSFQRSRQDFTEELYIRASFGGDREYAAKIEMDTTAGYFELPSYVRKSAGPLLQEDPVKKCNETRRCTYQWGSGTTEADGAASHIDASPKTSNKGPLVTLALALFGPGSIMDDKVELATGGGTETCAQGVPLATFFDSVSPCFDASSSDRIGESRASFLRNFLKTDKGDGTVKIAIDAAAFIVHDAWMTSTPGDFRLSRLLGIDVSAPELSDTNMIILSVLLGFYLSCLFAMSIFSALTPRWTDKLDSFAMLRIGAARPRSFPLMVSYRMDHVEALDKVPGWVGDKTDYRGEDEEHVCELGLGERPPLRRGIRYRCYYHDDQMPMPPKEG
ncbi:hypothetical protein NLG97_g4301 [Lecanicillium saksenae]|uniref:Uncharacterized protein n=1 Tax=Lecanicillium saksenae TaxID=468837 RepID=A0ACC1QVN6_9HYPO|nr:hypothetical protein NLG97_g4301 [Lecanicillium saksenae]